FGPHVHAGYFISHISPMTSFLADLSARTRLCSLSALVSFFFATSASAQVEAPTNNDQNADSDVEIEVDSDVNAAAESTPAEPSTAVPADAGNETQAVDQAAEETAQAENDKPAPVTQTSIAASAPEVAAAAEQVAPQAQAQAKP